MTIGGTARRVVGQLCLITHPFHFVFISCNSQNTMYNFLAYIKQRVKNMKQGIHPEYHKINVTMTNGQTVEMYSSVKKDLILSTDNLNHPAWTGQRSNTDTKGQRAAEFKSKFAGFKF